MRYFDHSIYACKIGIDEVEMDQTSLLENIIKFDNKFKTKTKEGKVKKLNKFDSVNALYKGQKWTFFQEWNISN